MSSLDWVRGEDGPALKGYFDGSKGASILFKLRVGSLELGGRTTWKEENKCMICTNGDIEDRIHFVGECPTLRGERIRLKQEFQDQGKVWEWGNMDWSKEDVIELCRISSKDAEVGKQFKRFLERIWSIRNNIS